jgi:hemoglobin/transferrin/lactoferrin receptor protein
VLVCSPSCCLATALMGLSAAAAAQSPVPSTALPALSNTATRTERRSDEVPATVSVSTAAEAEERAARDLKDLFRYEADLAVRAASPRFGAALGTSGRAGNEGLNVRGLEGNQVLLLVDGIRLPSAFSFGAFATGRLDSLALDSAHTVEVLRGPASTQFGSDGLAGALSVRTLQAADVLKPGQDFNGYARAAGSSLDGSVSAGGAVAYRQPGWDTLVVAQRRQGHEADTQGSNDAPDSRRTAPNPLRYTQSSVLAKLGVHPGPRQRVQATLEAVRRGTNSDVVSARTAPAAAPLAATAVLRLDAQDRVERDRASLQHEWEDLNAPWLQKAQTLVYTQLAQTRQLSLEDRNTAADRVRDNDYRERLVGAQTQVEASFSAPLAQRLSAGAEYSRNTLTAQRNGTVPPFGETYPSKPFPDTRFTLAGVFVQSELQLGALALIPALRLDQFRLRPDQSGYSGGTVVALSGRAATPRLGAVWQLSPTFAPYAQWARGWRAPTPEQVNNGFTNVASGYRSIGNPSLEPERAQNIELGLRGAAAGWRWQLAGYNSRYRGFISQEQIGGSFTPADPAIFQSINLASARIRGAELRVRYEPSARWQLRASAASARGDTERSGAQTPLNTVEPTKLALGALWRSAGWSLRADVLHVAAKDPARISQPAPPASPLFAPPSYTTLDLGLSWQPLRQLTLHLTLDNALDATYWRWSDVRGVAANSAALNAFTAPGRSAALVARLDF